MSQSPFEGSFFDAMTKNNPFAAFLPTADAIEAASGNWANAMGVLSEGDNLVDLDAFRLDNAELPRNPVQAAAAGSAFMMGMAGQMYGLWAGSVAGALDAAAKARTDLQEGDIETFTAAMPNMFAWAFADPENAAAKAKPAAKTKPAAKPEVVAKPKPAAKAKQVEDIKIAKAPVSEPAKPKPAAKKAKPVAKAKPVEGIKIAKAPVSEPAKPKPAAKKDKKTTAKAVEKLTKTAVETADKLAAEKKAAPAAKRRQAANDTKPAAPEPVAITSPAPVAEKLETVSTPVMPEDFIKPKMSDKPAKPDDLKLIAGVGPKLEQVLNGLGIWTYSQIARWTPNEIAWVDDYLQFKGRIERDDWLAQAAALSKGGRDEYVKVFGKDPR